MEATAHSLLRQLTGKDRVGTLEQVLGYLNTAVHRSRRENRISKTTATRLISFSTSARHKIKMSDYDIQLVLRCVSQQHHPRAETPPTLDRKNFPPMGMPAIQLPPTSCDVPAPTVSSLATAQEALPPAPQQPTPAIQMMQQMAPPMMPMQHKENCWYQHRSGTMFFGVPPPEGVVRQGRIVDGGLVGM